MHHLKIISHFFLNIYKGQNAYDGEQHAKQGLKVR